MNEATDTLGDEPIFVDPSGRRRRIARNAGIVVGCLLAAYLAIVAFGVATGSRVPLTPWPASMPSAGARSPDGDVLRTVPAHQATTPRVQPHTAASASGARPTAAAPAPATSSARTSAGSAPTLPGRGHAYGITRAPHPKKS